MRKMTINLTNKPTLHSHTTKTTEKRTDEKNTEAINAVLQSRGFVFL